MATWVHGFLADQLIHSDRGMDKATRLAAVLFEYTDIGDGHAPVYSLAHVVNGQQRYLYCGQRLHFHARWAHGFNACSAGYGGAVFVGREVYGYARQRQRVTQRNQVAGFFGGHNAGHASYAQNIAFFSTACQNNCQRCGTHDNTPLGNGNTMGCRFGRYINHMSLTLGIKMSERVVLRIWHHAITERLQITRIIRP